MSLSKSDHTEQAQQLLDTWRTSHTQLLNDFSKHLIESDGEISEEQYRSVMVSAQLQLNVIEAAQAHALLAISMRPA